MDGASDVDMLTHVWTCPCQDDGEAEASWFSTQQEINKQRPCWRPKDQSNTVWAPFLCVTVETQTAAWDLQTFNHTHTLVFDLSGGGKDIDLSTDRWRCSSSAPFWVS